jgi:hypothetical protein
MLDGNLALPQNAAGPARVLKKRAAGAACHPRRSAGRTFAPKVSMKARWFRPT